MMKGLYQVLIRCFIVVLNLIYLPMKLLPVKNKIIMLSRQSDNISLDYKMLKDQFSREYPDIDVVIMTKKMPGNLIKMPGYLCHLVIQMYHLATARVAITDSYGIAISVLKHKKGLTIIQIWHALGAIKKFGYQTIGKASGHSEIVARLLKMHNNYDYILAVSDETVQYFCEAFNVLKDKAINLALPRAEYILTKNEESNKAICDYYNLGSEKENILYAPTFRKGQDIRLDELIDALDFDRFNLIVKLHPLDMETIDIPEKTGVIVDSRFLTYDLAKFCDRVITDYSALGIEISLLNKPLYFYIYDIDYYKNDPGLNVDLQREMGEYAFKCAAEFDDLLNNEYDYSVLENFRNKYISVDCQDATKKLTDFIITLVKEKY